MTRQRHIQRFRRTNRECFRNNIYRTSLVCKRCLTEIIQDVPYYIIRIYWPHTGHVISYRVRADKTNNLTRIDNSLFCSCGKFLGTVNNTQNGIRNLNYRYELNAHCVAKAMTIYNF